MKDLTLWLAARVVSSFLRSRVTCGQCLEACQLLTTRRCQASFRLRGRCFKTPRPSWLPKSCLGQVVTEIR